MTTTTKTLISACFAVALMLLAGTFLTAAEIEVNSAEPSSAEQGTINLDIDIRGNGFGRDSQVVFGQGGTCDPGPCVLGGISVKNVTRKGNKHLIANIDIAEGAIEGKFDIEVQSAGRKGSGKELFSVVKKQGEQLVSCAHVFGLASETLCDCQFKEPNDTTPGWELVGDCSTRTPLAIGQGLGRDGSHGWGAFLGNGHTVTAMSPWVDGPEFRLTFGAVGYTDDPIPAVFTNGDQEGSLPGSSVGEYFLIDTVIRVDDPSLASGCPGIDPVSPLESAIIIESAGLPLATEVKVKVGPTGSVGIVVGGEAYFCDAIRGLGVPARPADRHQLSLNIPDESYEQYGFYLRGNTTGIFSAAQSVIKSTIGCGKTTGSIPIYMENVFKGSVGDNVIACTNARVSVLINNTGTGAEPMAFSDNTHQGEIAIGLTDGTSAQFQGETFNADLPTDIAICTEDLESDDSLTFRKRPPRFNGYDPTKEIVYNCTYLP